jgi:hypothetical protein
MERCLTMHLSFSNAELQILYLFGPLMTMAHVGSNEPVFFM